MERLSRAFAGVVRGLARGRPSERRHWVQALQAEADMVPAGRQRLSWIIGGVWLVMREGHVARKTVYWLGTCAIAGAAAWAIWLSWRAAPSADSEAMTDRARVLVGASALLVLPHLRRGQGWFGPVSNGITARVVRLVGCATICATGIALVRLDSHAGTNGIAAAIMYGIVNIPEGDQYAALFMLLVLPGLSFLMGAFAGVAGAWRVTGGASPQELRQARIRQGLFAGLIAGAAAGLLLELAFVGFGIMMVIGPLAGVGGGSLGAAIVADHRRQPGSDGVKAAGLSVAKS